MESTRWQSIVHLAQTSKQQQGDEFPGFQSTLLCCKRSGQNHRHTAGSTPGCLATGPGRLCTPAARPRRAAAALHQQVPGCRGLPHRQLSRSSAALPADGVGKRGRSSLQLIPVICPVPQQAGRGLVPARTRGEAYHRKGLQSQSRLASKSLLNHMQREVYSRALKASRDHEGHPAQPPVLSPLP